MTFGLRYSQPDGRPHPVRLGRKAADAVRAAQRYAETGKDWVVDMDIAKFFDHVNGDILMGKIAAVVRDKRVLRLIGRYLRAGAMGEGVRG
jgi:RNA-directed DNA polymerase